MPKKKLKSGVHAKEMSSFEEKFRLPSSRSITLSKKTRKKYTVKSPYLQIFSFPSNVIFYIARNPAFPIGHLKFISTCKFLARMNRILPVTKLRHLYDKDPYKWKAENPVIINLKNQFLKLWIYDELLIYCQATPNLASILTKHCYKFSLREIQIRSQVMTFEELKILVSGGNLEDVYFDKNVIKNDDGKITEFEKVFELLCCKKLEIRFNREYHGVSKNTANKIGEILSTIQIPEKRNIQIKYIPPNFDFLSFSQFLKANMTFRQHTIDLEFVEEISDEYKTQLQEFVNEIIQIRGIYAHIVPLIVFPGHDWEAFIKLRRMRYEN